MKYIKRILGFLLAAMLAFSVAVPAAHAESDPNTQIITIGGDNSSLEYFNGLVWNPLVVPFWITMTNGGNISYCLESNKTQPTGEGYHVSQALYSDNVLSGVKAILLYGYPNDHGGLNTTQAWYATQAAIWTWMYESAGVGYNSMAEQYIRPAAGREAVYDFYLSLLDYARRGVDEVYYAARYNPYPLTLTSDGQGHLTGTGTMELLDNLDSYSIDQSKLPDGVTLTGNTYLDGDTFTLSVPMRYAGQTQIIQDCFRLHSNRSPANIFWYESDAGSLQNMVVYDMELKPAHSIGLTFAAQDIKQGRIIVNKQNANPAMGDYSLAGAEFDIMTSTRQFVETVTTNAQGVAQSRLLDLGNYIVVEKTAPFGFVRNSTELAYPLTDTGADEITLNIDVPEQPQAGVIRVNKMNADAASGDYSLRGAVFEVHNAGGVLVDTVTTGDDGKAQSKKLPLSSYTVTEKTAPQGFVRNQNTFGAQLSYCGQDVDIVYVDVVVSEQPQVGKITVTKKDAGVTTPTEPPQPQTTVPTTETAAIDSSIMPTIIAATTEPTTAAVSTTKPNSTIRTTETFNDTSIDYYNDTTPSTTAVTTTTAATTTATSQATPPAATGTTAQGDATLAGAVFEVYASDKTTLVDKLYCVSGVTATTRELPLGTYYVREKFAPEGYNLDEKFHQVKLEYGDQDVAVVSTGYELKNKVIEGQIAITKHIDEAMEGYDDPQIEQPLAGAKFEVYLESAGSYDAAKESERDLLETDENGCAISKQLPYGTYIVKEISAPGDVKLVAPFKVFISQEGKIHRFILNDILFRSPVKIVKVDAETQKPIAAAGTTFKIRDLATGEFIAQHVNYPTPADISEFETAVDGMLVLPEPLKSGDYELVEVLAPRGYLLSDKPVKFTVSSSQEGETVTVTMENKPVMGKVKVEKTGNMLKGVKEIETIFGMQYLPVFELGHLVGAEFDVVAAEDIVTPDGTLRAKKGDVVDHIITGEDGLATSKELYLGEYALVETKAPENYVLDATPHPVSLVYEDQTVAVVTSQIGISNARQMIEIELTKRMEGFDKFDHFEDVIFGLYTAEDIYAEDGKLLLPKDSLILTQDSLMALAALDKEGHGRFEGELPFAAYYVRELQTAEGFVLDNTKYPVDARYTGQENAAKKIAVNGGEAIVNRRAQGAIKVVKLDSETKKPLAGAKFGLYQGGKLLFEKTTGADGIAEFSPLPFGEYTVKELAAPKGYDLIDEHYTETLRHGQEIITITVLNSKTPEKPEVPDKPDAPDEPTTPEKPTQPNTPDEPEKPTEPGKPEPGKPVSPQEPLPKTGDNPALWITLLCVIAGAGIAAAVLLTRKKKEEELEDVPDETE